MTIFQLVGFAFVALFLTLVVKKISPELGIYIPLICGMIIFFFVADKLYAIIELLINLSDKLKMGDTYITIIIKMIGVAFLAEFAADTCRDSGETAIANKIEFAGKVIILCLGIPIITALLEIIINLLKQ